MAYPTVRDLWIRVGAIALTCGSLWVALQATAAQMGSLGGTNSSLKKVGLVIHGTDKRGSPIPPTSLKGVEVIEHGEKLQVVDGPQNVGPTQVAVLIDSNFHQRKVLGLEQQTAAEMLSEFERRKAQALVMSYGAEIQSSGKLTDEWPALKEFTGSLRVETDKHNETILLFDALKRAMEALGDGPGTKAVVVFAEGNDNGSSIGWKNVARLAQQDHIACYVVLFADHTFYGTKAIRHYGWDLVELAPKAGGGLWEAGDSPREAHKDAQQIKAALDTQGLIEVLVPNVDTNRFHSIKVTCPGYQVKAQTGYYDASSQPL
jgi:hypothetical protein